MSAQINLVGSLGCVRKPITVSKRESRLSGFVISDAEQAAFDRFWNRICNSASLKSAINSYRQDLRCVTIVFGSTNELSERTAPPEAIQ